MTFKEQQDQYIEMVETALEKHLGSVSFAATRTIYEATAYSLFAGGKRLRSSILLAFCQMCGGDLDQALPFAAALEMIHTYSLIHDDLPCMDNDDLRRGKLTNHKVFGEAIAVLSGDALLNRAFETILNRENSAGLPAETVMRASFYLAEAAGMDGMIGGQVMDIEAEHQKIEYDDVVLLQRLKTGCLIQVAAVMGVVVAGKLDEDTITAARAYGNKLGLAFQIKDDILDVTGATEKLGKSTGKDRAAEKSTFVSLLGLVKCEEMVKNLTNEAIDSLQQFEKSDFLKSFAYNLIDRTN